MPNLSKTVSNLIGLTLAVLLTLAAQAHFTDRYTPGLAAQVEEMTPRSHRAFWFLNLSYPHTKKLFGVLDFLVATQLWRASTRRLGLRLAIVGFASGLYGQWYTDGEMGQVAALLGLAIVGAALS